MQRVPVSWILTIVSTVPLIAQDATFGTAVAAHSATYAPSGPEQFGIAQGSIFVVFGSNLGPTKLVQANSFPLQTRLAGTSIELEVNGVTHPAVMIYTSANQVAALVPSNTPAGDGTLTVTYANTWSSRAAIKIVPSAFGIYTVAQTGRGPGIVTNSTYRVNSTSFAANPGETLIIWGTGLGPVSGNEAGGPLPGNLRSDAQVFVGTTAAHVRYAGRSGCCAGLDQITFDVPAGIAGCFVPLAVRVGGVVSNFTSLSIAAPGRQCSDPAGLPAMALNQAASSGSLRVGAIALGQTGLLGAMSDRIRWRRINSPFALALASLLGPGTAAAPASTAPARQLRNRVRQLIQTYRQQQRLTGKRTRLSRKAIRRALAQMPDQTITADFSSLPYAALLVPHLLSTISAVGSCSVATCATRDCGLSAALPQDHYVISPLDAGPQLSFSGPAGLLALPRWSAGQYGAEFASGSQGQLPAGDYVVNGPGGADVDPFTAGYTVYSPLSWTNKDAIGLIDRTRDLTVTWNQSRAAGYVLVGGISSSHVSTSSSVFICSEKAAKGSFTIPSFVLSTLPVDPAGTLPAPGYLFMAIHPLANTFTARGIDLGYFTDLSLDMKEVQYR
ncbi:MAG TPA: hypothetical protein VJN43_08790 [Bryobacteraceae bacterium]|nr:hypothetical protein [Bryobacteraceae bacterium]